MLFHKLMAVGRELLIWIDANTPKSIKSNFSMPLFEMIQKSRKNLLRIIHYPPLKAEITNGSILAAEHGDINLITILPAGSQPGLQVLTKDGQWVDVKCNPGWLVINTGDMLQECSKGYYPSTIHRVINPKGKLKSKSRFSMPLFIHPRDEVQLSKRYSVNSFLNKRLREIGLKN